MRGVHQPPSSVWWRFTKALLAFALTAMWVIGATGLLLLVAVLVFTKATS